LNAEAYFHEIKVDQLAVSVVFSTIFPHNTLLWNQFKSSISTTHQQLLNQLKKIAMRLNNLPTLNCPHPKLISAQI